MLNILNGKRHSQFILKNRIFPFHFTELIDFFSKSRASVCSPLAILSLHKQEGRKHSINELLIAKKKNTSNYITLTQFYTTQFTLFICGIIYSRCLKLLGICKRCPYSQLIMICCFYLNVNPRS